MADEDREDLERRIAAYQEKILALPAAELLEKVIAAVCGGIGGKGFQPMGPNAIYVVTFRIGPVEQPASVGLRVAELIAVLKRDPNMADVEVQITRDDSE